METLFWVALALGTTAAIAHALSSREARLRRRRRRLRWLRRQVRTLQGLRRRRLVVDRGPGYPLVGHPADCPCRDDHTVHMWVIPNLYQGTDR